MANSREDEGEGAVWGLQANDCCQDVPSHQEAQGGYAQGVGDSARMGSANPESDLAQATIIYYLVFSMYYVLFIRYFFLNYHLSLYYVFLLCLPIMHYLSFIYYVLFIC